MIVVAHANGHSQILQTVAQIVQFGLECFVMATKRNYKSEYKNYHSKPKQKKRRANRNTARAKMVRAGKARKGDGKDVHHKNRNTKDNRAKNLSVISKRSNRSYSRKKK